MSRPAADIDNDAAESQRVKIIAERAAQGLGPTVTDPAMLAVLAAVLGSKKKAAS